MRKITEESVEAFLAGRSFSKSNMKVKVEDEVARLYLCGKCIGINNDGEISISNAGWPTVTTKDRINGILSMLGKPEVSQKNFVWYWENGVEFIDDRFYRVNT